MSGGADRPLRSTEASSGAAARPCSPRRLAVIAFASLFVAMSWLAQDDGWTQSAHYALVRSLSQGTAQIDQYRSETGDLSYRDGHYYAAKAPGVALVSLPAYVVLDSAGVWPDSHRGAIWLLALFNSVLPALVLVAVVSRVADGFEPGSGLATGLTLATGTLVLPFSTVAFSHIWAALLVFSGFALLLRERRGPGRLGLVAVAGMLAGLATVFEYPSALAALILGGLAIARSGWAMRGVVYGAGVVLGVTPLLVYNAFAFGSPFTNAYVDAVVTRGASGHDVVGAHSHGVFGVTSPSLRTLAELLLADRGLLALTPVVVGGVAGLVLLLRARRERAAALTGLAVVLAYPFYNAGVTTTFGGAFGGLTPGPRYLITALPFALMSLGVAYRRAPGAVLGLAAVSTTTMVAATVTYPLVAAGETGRWWDSLVDGRLTDSVAWLHGVGGTGYLAAAPFLVGVAVAWIVATMSFVRLQRPQRGELASGAAVVGVWLVLAVGGTRLLTGIPSLVAGGLALVLLAVACAVGVAAVRGAATREPAVPRSAPGH